MQIEVLLVANQAVVENGLLSVAGGGWETFTPAMFPATLRGVIAGIVTLSDGEIGDGHAVSFSMTDPDGHVAGTSGSMIISGIRPRTRPGVPVRVPFDIPFSTVVSAPTVVKVGITQGTTELAAVTFAVLDPIPDSPTG